MIKTLNIFFGIAFFILIASCNPLEFSKKYDGYWVVTGSNNGKELGSGKILQWKIDGATVLTTVNFSKDMEAIGITNWPGEQIELSIVDSILQLSRNGLYLNFHYEYNDYGVMGYDELKLQLIDPVNNLQIRLIKRKPK